MPIVMTSATKKILQMSRRIRVVQGGTSASKTFSIIICLIHLAQTDENPTVTSIVSESVPHLRRGAIKDFKTILKEQGYWNENRWSISDSRYEFETGSVIEFFSSDSSDKLRGARRDRLFINEANNVEFEAFNQLEVRTKELIFIDFNPTCEFWFYTDILNKRDDVEHIILTYKDNEALSQDIVDSIEKRKENTQWFRVYGLGLLGEYEGKIFRDWKIIDEIPHEAKLIRRGLDFGYSNDPTAIVDLYKLNSEWILDEKCYQKGLSNREIADILKNYEPVLTVADSAEPKSIDELKSYGLNVIPAQKGPGSILQGIQLVQDKRISVTKRSVSLIREYRNYMWMTDRDGKTINEPIDAFNHCMDAIRYAIPKEFVLTLEKKNEIEFYRAMRAKKAKRRESTLRMA